MARVHSLGRVRSLGLVAKDAVPQIDVTSLPKQALPVVALYDKLLKTLDKLGALVKNGASAQVDTLRMQCVQIIKALDTGLTLKGELAQNLHILYGHCLRRLLVQEVYTESEALDSVRLVVSRLYFVYCEAMKKEYKASSSSQTSAE